MTLAQAKKLKVGDRLRWRPIPGEEEVSDPPCDGTVLDREGKEFISIGWDDGKGVNAGFTSDWSELWKRTDKITRS